MSDGAPSDGVPGHLAIGEVLALLQTEFPDVTISKIRFLEAQGLIVPERTAAGYRKFYDADIEMAGGHIKTDTFRIKDKKLTLAPIEVYDADGRLLMTYDKDD